MCWFHMQWLLMAREQKCAIACNKLVKARQDLVNEPRGSPVCQGLEVQIDHCTDELNLAVECYDPVFKFVLNTMPDRRWFLLRLLHPSVFQLAARRAPFEVDEMGSLLRACQVTPVEPGRGAGENGDDE
jgi:hypothetical protein